MLGSRGSTVHNAPTRATLEGNSTNNGDHLDAVSNLLLPRYREVAAEMAPFRQRTIYEAHPELSFYQLNSDRPLHWTKRFEVGRAERQQAPFEQKRIPGVGLILDAPLENVTQAHLLDAAAMLWTARRIFSRSAMRLPVDPEWDGQGLRMELVL